VTESRGTGQVHDVEPADATAPSLTTPDLDRASEAALGEPAAGPRPLEFRALFEQNFTYVWHTLRRLGVPDRDLEDLAHDVFFEVYRARHRFDPARPARAWLFGFAFRIASQHRRRARNRFEVLDDPGERPDGAPTALDHVLDTEALGVAHRALEAIEINRRAVFVMHEVDGFSIPEVAEALAIPLNTAYSRLRLARQEFHERVERLRRRQGDP
jgi:RNA polymerase sigma-70 factor (ECF subfamily)